MSIAIVTGASSGLGIEFVGALSERFKNLEEIWVISRSADKLGHLSELFPGVTLRYLPLDLTDKKAFSVISEALAERDMKIRFLINNAGYGKLGNFDECDTDNQAGMVTLNCEGLLRMTSVCLPHMESGACIINVASIAAFAPNPRMTVYSSTKAFVLSFSKGLRYELKERKINVLAVCPGPMATSFLDVAGITRENSKTFRMLPYCDPAKVARTALMKAVSGNAVYTPRVFFKFYRIVAKLIPHNFIMPMSKA